MFLKCAFVDDRGSSGRAFCKERQEIPVPTACPEGATNNPGPTIQRLPQMH